MKTNGIPQANQENLSLIQRSKIFEEQIKLYQLTISDYQHWLRFLELDKERLDSHVEDTSIIDIVITSHRQQIVELQKLLKTSIWCKNHIQEELFINSHYESINIENVLYANDVKIEDLPPAKTNKLLAIGHKLLAYIK